MKICSVRILCALLVLSFYSCGHLTNLSSKKTAQSSKDQNGKGIHLRRNFYPNSDQSWSGNDEIKSSKEEDRVHKIQASPASFNGQILGSSTLDHHLSSSKDVYFLSGAEHLKLKNYFFDIPVVYNDAVKKWLHYFLNKGKDYFVRYSERAGRYAPILGKILEDHGLPRDLIFLAMAESGFYNQARSWAKAVGAWQFMPFTGKRYGLKINWFVDERKDPIKSTIAASRYLRKLYNDFGSWELAAAGYNAGEGKVTRAIRRYKTENFWDLRKERYLKMETKDYLPKIMSLAIIGKNLESFGFKDIDFHEPLDFDEIEVPGNTDLYEVAAATGVPYEEVHRLNPELLRWTTPPYEPVYKLRMPVGTMNLWNECCRERNFIATKYQTYQVEDPTTLAKVASQLKLQVGILAELNSMEPSKILSPNTTILLPFREDHQMQDAMYADLYEPVRQKKAKIADRGVRTRRLLGQSLKPRRIHTKSLYVVQKGDTLWQISRKMGVSVRTIVKSNIHLSKVGTLREGDKLIIR